MAGLCIFCFAAMLYVVGADREGGGNRGGAVQALSGTAALRSAWLAMKRCAMIPRPSQGGFMILWLRRHCFMINSVSAECVEPFRRRATG